jgi:small subunit ribosomal protein S18
MEKEKMSEQMENQNVGRSPRRFIARPKFCQFCADKTAKIDYKNIDMMRRFVTEDGRIRPRRQTGTCARHQRALATAIKRARHLAFLPYKAEDRQENY